MKRCVTRLSPDALTQCNWTGRDELGHHFGRIPLAKSPISLALYWKRDKASAPLLVGCFRIDLKCLLDRNLVRDYSDGTVLLRFFRTEDGKIAIGLNSTSPHLPIGDDPIELNRE